MSKEALSLPDAAKNVKIYNTSHIEVGADLLYCSFEPDMSL